jgi:hypothetical protein
VKSEEMGERKKRVLDEFSFFYLFIRPKAVMSSTSTWKLEARSLIREQILTRFCVSGAIKRFVFSFLPATWRLVLPHLTLRYILLLCRLAHPFVRLPRAGYPETQIYRHE